MTQIIIPNSRWRIFRRWRLLQSNDLSKLPQDIDKGKFEPDPLTNEELVAIETRIQLQSNPEDDLILGSSDFLPFDFLDKGRTAGKAVCCLLRRFTDSEVDNIIELTKQDAWIRGQAIKWFVDENSLIDPAKDDDKEEFKKQAQKKWVPCATGFLIAKNYLLTNLHVVEEKAHLSEFCAEFGYDADLSKTTRYSFDPNFWKPSQNANLDYVLLKLQPSDDGQEAGEVGHFTPINLATLDSVQITPWFSPQDIDSLHEMGKLNDDRWNELKGNGFGGDLVNIIQHPEGRSKEIVIFNNQLETLYKDFLVYTSDTQPGSSGSPLFNARWELIGLHQAALLNVEGKRVTGYLGIRISSILADLRTQAKNKPDLEIKAFLDAVFPPKSIPESVPKPISRQVFILAGRNRSNILPQDLAELEKTAMLRLQKQVQEALNKLDSTLDIRLIDGSNQNLEKAIQEINQKAKSPVSQNVAIELLTDHYPENSNLCGISVYYNGSNVQGKNYAEALLNSIKDIPKFSVGTYSDQATRGRRLKFCRQTKMPALVFYAGYLSNLEDLARIKALQTEISPMAEAIAAGLLAWIKYTSDR
jgi:V8-like Glu-specific endopeptidase